MKRCRICLIVLALALAGPLGAQDPRPEERGYPILQVYAPGDYDGSTQNFDIAQAPDGLIYVANLAGLLVHDGAWWQRVSLANHLAVFCVAADAQGRIAAGGVGEFGYLEADAHGSVVYKSLLPLLPPDQREVGDVWSIHATEPGFVFLTDAALIRWDGTRLAILERFDVQAGLVSTHAVGDRLFVAIPGRGLHRVAGDSLSLARGGEAFTDRRIDMMLPTDSEALLLAVRDEGLLLWDGETAKPWAPVVSALLTDTPARGGVRLPDGRYALATRGGGVVLVGAAGSLDRVIDTSAGLPNDMVYQLMLDHEGSLWAALDDGLARIEATAPLSVFDRRAGLEGAVGAIARHAGRLWVGSRVGLFVLDESQGPARMRRIKSIPADTAKPLDVGDEMLVAARDGVYVGGLRIPERAQRAWRAVDACRGPLGRHLAEHDPAPRRDTRRCGRLPAAAPSEHRDCRRHPECRGGRGRCGVDDEQPWAVPLHRRHRSPE